MAKPKASKSVPVVRSLNQPPTATAVGAETPGRLKVPCPDLAAPPPGVLCSPPAAAKRGNGESNPPRSTALAAPGEDSRPTELASKVRDLVRLAREQGYLTYGDVNESLPESMMTPECLDEIYIQLRGLDVEIVDQAEVDRVKQTGTEEEEDRPRLDILDDPWEYLKQMGQVALLTR